ncbi:MAG TPA: hypothetical protein DEA08_32250 [Planctomycetes bacterium]|nr:hypothetical protein [Planctomycetota bacterium]
MPTSPTFSTSERSLPSVPTQPPQRATPDDALVLDGTRLLEGRTVLDADGDVLVIPPTPTTQTPPTPAQTLDALFPQEDALPAGPVLCGALALLLAGATLLLAAPRGRHRPEPFPNLLSPRETRRVLSASNLRRATLRGAAGAAVLTATYVCASLLSAVAGLGGAVEPWGLVLTCALGLSFAPAALPELWAERRDPSRRLDLGASALAGLLALAACAVALLQVTFVAERAEGAGLAEGLSSILSLGSSGLIALLVASLPVAGIASLLCYQRLRHATCAERTPLDRVHDVVLGLFPAGLLGLISLTVVAIVLPQALTTHFLRELLSSLGLTAVVGLSTLMALSCAAAGADQVERNLLVQARDSAR